VRPLNIRVADLRNVHHFELNAAVKPRRPAVEVKKTPAPRRFLAWLGGIGKNDPAKRAGNSALSRFKFTSDLSEDPPAPNYIPGKPPRQAQPRRDTSSDDAMDRFLAPLEKQAKPAGKKSEAPIDVPSRRPREHGFEMDPTYMGIEFVGQIAAKGHEEWRLEVPVQDDAKTGTLQDLAGGQGDESVEGEPTLTNLLDAMKTKKD
jgi:hypothetical protein